jgi:lipid-A-disaccharide synthase-like uncharacterized protein
MTGWKLIGYVGALMFGGRWLVQFIASKRAGKPVIPRLFWYMSVVGSLMTLSYFLFSAKQDSVGVLQNLFPAFTACTACTWTSATAAGTATRARTDRDFRPVHRSGAGAIIGSCLRFWSASVKTPLALALSAALLAASSAHAAMPVKMPATTQPAESAADARFRPSTKGCWPGAGHHRRGRRGQRRHRRQPAAARRGPAAQQDRLKVWNDPGALEDRSATLSPANQVNYASTRPGVQPGRAVRCKAYEMPFNADPRSGPTCPSWPARDEDRCTTTAPTSRA